MPNIEIVKRGFNPLAITPPLHYSTTPRLFETENAYDDSPSFGTIPANLLG
jgi:hypothetical protein